ncbi:hypothetical protein J4210_06045 [Candidatus Woesearchaeota archaeon]|nr:hypothetical protein [Candidatus Woesearchaeota archaeon]
MTVQPAKSAVRSSKSQPSTAVPVIQHKGRMIGLIIFAIVLVAGIAAVLLYGTEFAGKAVALAPETLKVGEAGIPIKAGTTMKVGETQDMTVYANLGEGDAYGFRFLLKFNPKIIRIADKDIVNALDGITLLSVKSSQQGGFMVLEVVGMSTLLNKEGKPLKTLREVGSVTKKSLVPLVKINKVSALNSGLSGLSFTVFEVYDKDTNLNLITKKQPQIAFYVGAAPVAKLGEGAACQNNAQCVSKLCEGGVCVALVGEEPPTDLPLKAVCINDANCQSGYCAVPLEAGSPSICCPANTCHDNTGNVALVCAGDGAISGNKQAICNSGVWEPNPGAVACMDTDNGLDVDKKGIVTLPDGSKSTDYCTSDSEVKEYYCNAAGAVTNGNIACPSGKSCKDGACLAVAPPVTDAKTLADTDGNGCLSLSEYNKFKEDYKNNVNGIQEKITLSQYNKLKEDYKNGVGGIQC